MGTWMFLATVGAFTMAIGLLLVLIDVVYTSVVAPGTANPWGADTLEWLADSPPKPYNFPVIPTVSSLHPAWDERTTDSVGTGATADRILADGRTTLLTSELDARQEKAVHMPGPTSVPFVTSALLLVTAFSLILGGAWNLVAAAGSVASAIACAYWLWPSEQWAYQEEASS